MPRKRNQAERNAYILCNEIAESPLPLAVFTYMFSLVTKSTLNLNGSHDFLFEDERLPF